MPSSTEFIQMQEKFQKEVAAFKNNKKIFFQPVAEK